MSWKCSCGIVNVGISESYECSAAKTWHSIQHEQVSANTITPIRSWVATKEVNKEMTPNEELFATYYNRGKILVKDMDDTSLREHREQLRQIATEAKAQLLASDDEIRERQAKKGPKEWLVTTDTSQSVSDAINVVEKRRARMTKMDKLKQQLIDIGMDDATIKETIGNLERRATDKSLKTVTFKKKTEEDSVVQVKTKPDSNGEPFDPTKLVFGK
jgi:hypothetical protein